ncbi:hypothetical protein QQZ08_005653 [Neonectria magnoliae]|uniref:Uncharacterized protein n=1 Tax=Neonectria magnoliae TaxID=2732573 RepID=A0ABR1I4E6_9HYPO
MVANSPYNKDDASRHDELIKTIKQLAYPVYARSPSDVTTKVTDNRVTGDSEDLMVPRPFFDEPGVDTQHPESFDYLIGPKIPAIDNPTKVYGRTAEPKPKGKFTVGKYEPNRVPESEVGFGSRVFEKRPKGEKKPSKPKVVLVPVKDALEPNATMKAPNRQKTTTTKDIPATDRIETPKPLKTTTTKKSLASDKTEVSKPRKTATTRKSTTADKTETSKPKKTTTAKKEHATDKTESPKHQKTTATKKELAEAEPTAIEDELDIPWGDFDDDFVSDEEPVPNKSKHDQKGKTHNGVSKRTLRNEETWYVNEYTTVITLINATPYRWRRGYIHSYQMSKWEKDWPLYIEPGQSRRIVTYRMNGNNLWDSSAEVVYHLEGTEKPMSFMVERRSGKKHHVFVRFLEDLETINNGKKSEFDLGYTKHPGGSNFILAGKEGNFVSTKPPIAWMKTLLPEIGHLPLREIVMPRSHHAGLSVSKRGIGFVVPANTLCQKKLVRKQLEEEGVRVLDVRPFVYANTFRAAHGSMIAGAWNGMLGETIWDITNAVAEFHKAFPGELIIIDIPADETGRIEYGYKKFRDKDRKALYKALMENINGTVVPDNEDITKWPLERLIGNGTSATLIRVDDSWGKKKDFPGGARGFVTHKNFPTIQRWSNKNRAEKMVLDQLEHLRLNRPSRDSKIFHSDWLRTQSSDDAALPTKSIRDMAIVTYGWMYSELWDAVTDHTYPNWLATDNIQRTELSSFVVALNHCMVARKCGDLGGKVTGGSNADARKVKAVGKEKTASKGETVDKGKKGDDKEKSENKDEDDWTKWF